MHGDPSIAPRSQRAAFGPFRMCCLAGAEGQDGCNSGERGELEYTLRWGVTGNAACLAARVRVCRTEHPRAVILSYRACASRCENPFGQSDQKSPHESEKDNETLKAVLLIGVFAAMGVVPVLGQVHKYFTPGTVWTVTMVRMASGMDQSNLQYLDGQFKKSGEAQVKAGSQKCVQNPPNVGRRRRMDPVAPQGRHRPGLTSGAWISQAVEAARSFGAGRDEWLTLTRRAPVGKPRLKRRGCPWPA